MSLVHTEVMQLRATPDQVRGFILTPERILDYFPQPVEGGVLEPGKAIYCRGEMGTSMLALVDAESTEDLVVVEVTLVVGIVVVDFVVFITLDVLRLQQRTAAHEHSDRLRKHTKAVSASRSCCRNANPGWSRTLRSA